MIGNKKFGQDKHEDCKWDKFHHRASATRNFALLDLLFLCCSSSVARIGSLVIIPIFVCRKNVFTIRSSNEWKLIATSLPPDTNTFAAPLSPSRSTAISSLTVDR